MTLLSIVMSDPVPPGAPILLVPRLVDAFGFRQLGLEVEHGEIIAEITATNSRQAGYVIRPTGQPLRPVLNYRLEAFDGPPPDWIWTPPDTRYARASASLAAHAGEVFWYGHGIGSLMDGRDCVPLLTRPTRGHCVDMHGYCVAACSSIGIAAAYCAGFWFKAGSAQAPGMHCWFAARADGEIVHYDVSHQLKLPTLPILPGLNPIPGIRFLAAAGKGVAFETPLGRLETSHFAKPIWLTGDGRDHFPAHEVRLEMPALAPRLAQLEPAC